MANKAAHAVEATIVGIKLAKRKRLARLRSFYGQSMLIKYSSLSLNGIWRKCRTFTYEYVKELFRERKNRTNCLGAIVSRKNKSLKNCVVFFEYNVTQRFSPSYVIPKKTAYTPALCREKIILAFRYDDGIKRKTFLIIP